MPYPILSLESIPPIEPYLSARRDRADDYGTQIAFASVLFERELYYSVMYTPWGPHGLTPPDSHSAAWQPFPASAQGRTALAARREFVGSVRDQPLDLFGLKAEALRGLQNVLRPRKAALNGYLLAARFAVDLCDFDAAMSAVDGADQVSPDHGAALLYRYDTALLRESLASVSAGFGRRLRRVFGPNWPKEAGRAREKHESQIRRHAWRARTATEGDRFTRFLTTEQQWCDDQRALAAAGVDERIVPESFRHLLPLASRFGVGDDVCRAYFIRKAPKREQQHHLEQAKLHLDDIQRWVDTHEADSLPPEAALFFWLLVALEEMR